MGGWTDWKDAKVPGPDTKAMKEMRTLNGTMIVEPCKDCKFLVNIPHMTEPTCKKYEEQTNNHSHPAWDPKYVGCGLFTRKEEGNA